jgi:HK97 family phage portal protein
VLLSNIETEGADMRFDFWNKEKTTGLIIPTSKRQKVEKKDYSREIIVPLLQGSWLDHIFSNNNGYVSPQQAMRLYENCSAVATVADMIAESIQGIVPSLKTKDGKYITDHPCLDLLDRPNGFQAYDDFIGDVVRNYVLKHDSHIIAIGNVDRIPIQLYSIKPFNVFPVPHMGDFYAYNYTVVQGIGMGAYDRFEQGNNLVRYYDNMRLKEFFHIMGYTSKTYNLEGTSPLCAASLEAKQLIKGKYHNLKLLENGGRLSLIIAFKGETPDEEEHARRKQRLYEDLTGENTGGIAVTSFEEMEIKELGNTNKDMDFIQLEELAAKVIYQRYRIPLPLISNDAATYNNFETALVALYDWAVIPTYRKIFAGLSRLILPRAKIDPTEMWFDFDPEQLPALRTRRLEELKLRREVNIETINEMRKDIPNREPVDGGDVIYIPSTMMPAGSTLFSTDNTVSGKTEPVAPETPEAGSSLEGESTLPEADNV